MKILIAAAALLAVGATTASAQYAPYRRDHHRYEDRHHAECQHKAMRLHDFERRAARVRIRLEDLCFVVTVRAGWR